MSQADALISTPTGSAVAVALAAATVIGYPRILEHADTELEEIYIPVAVAAGASAATAPAVGEIAAGLVGAVSIVGVTFTRRRKAVSAALVLLPVGLSQEPLALAASTAIFIGPMLGVLAVFWKAREAAVLPSFAVLAHLLDVLTTAAALRSGASESGLIASAIIDKLGVAGFGVTKLALVSGALLVLYGMEGGDERDYFVFVVAILGLVAGARNLVIL